MGPTVCYNVPERSRHANLIFKEGSLWLKVPEEEESKPRVFQGVSLQTTTIYKAYPSEYYNYYYLLKTQIKD